MLYRSKSFVSMLVIVFGFSLCAILAVTVTAQVVQPNNPTGKNGSGARASIQPQNQPAPANPPAPEQAASGSSATAATAGSAQAGAAPAAAAQAPTADPQPTNIYQVNEQFEGNSINNSLWEVMTLPKAYRNNEEQDYRPSQVKVEAGTLQIRADRDNSGQWHSGEVHSRWNYTYGEFEVRVAVSATGPGVWPAAWLMGTTDSWPNNGELDIFENINGYPQVYGTIHGGGSNGHWQLQKVYSAVNVTQFHTYRIIKQPGVISWWVDGVKRGEWHQSQTPPDGVWPFENHRNFGLLNLAIGGNWPGPSNGSTPSSIIMFIDYFTVKNGY